MTEDKLREKTLKELKKRFQWYKEETTESDVMAESTLALYHEACINFGLAIRFNAPTEEQDKLEELVNRRQEELQDAVEARDYEYKSGKDLFDLTTIDRMVALVKRKELKIKEANENVEEDL